MNKIYKKILCVALTVTFFVFSIDTTCIAQVKIGLPTGAPNAGALLDASNTGAAAGSAKGFLPPTVTLTANNVWGLAGTATPGMMVFNTGISTSGSNPILPGIYVWLNAQWNIISMSPVLPVAVISNIDCSGGLGGSYYTGTPTTALNTKVVNVTFTTAGTYNLSTSNDGFTFAASGTATIGVNSIVFTATGSPILSSDAIVFNLINGSQSSSFNVPISGFYYFNNFRSLSTSVPAYIAATTNTWVSITAAEYDLLKTKYNILIYGATDAAMSANSTEYFGDANIPDYNYNYACTLSSNNPYPVAFEIKTGPNCGSIADIQLGFGTIDFPATGVRTPYVPFLAPNTQYYFILKGATIPITSFKNIYMSCLGDTQLQRTGNSINIQILMTRIPNN